jgi:hypothetical protein
MYNIRDLFGHFVKLPPKSRENGMCPHACCKGKRPHPDRFPVLLPKAMLHSMSDEELYAHYDKPGVGESGRAVRQVLAEMDRRERRQQRHAHRATRADEYRAYLEDQWVNAEQATRGNMLNKRGRASGIDPRALWSDARARNRYASDELRSYLDAHPVVSAREFHGEAAQAAGARRRRQTQLYGVY